MGGKPEALPDTASQKAQAQVAKAQWKLYQEKLKPLENIFINRLDGPSGLNAEDNYLRAAGVSNLGYQTAFSDARQQTASQLFSKGASNPADQKFRQTIDDMGADQMQGQLDNSNRYQVSQADKYVAGLQDIAALGAGQKADALRGFSSLADTSMHKAAAEADMANSKRQFTADLIGQGLRLGADAAYGYKLGLWGNNRNQSAPGGAGHSLGGNYGIKGY